MAREWFSTNAGLVLRNASSTVSITFSSPPTEFSPFSARFFFLPTIFIVYLLHFILLVPSASHSLRLKCRSSFEYENGKRPGVGRQLLRRPTTNKGNNHRTLSRVVTILLLLLSSVCVLPIFSSFPSFLRDISKGTQKSSSYFTRAAFSRSCMYKIE